jgi:chromosome partitioning protein
MKHHEAPTLVPLGLAGGQGKTTIALMTGRLLASYGIPVLFVDADPQASLTAFLGVEPSEERPTLLEVLTKPAKKIPLYSAIHPVANNDKLFVIPANDELEDANHSLAASPMSVSILRNRLYQIGESLDQEDRVVNNFGVIIVDPPPERSHLALTSLGAGNFWVIPAEANIKGVQSLKRTKEMIESCQPMVPHGKWLGVIPFRARWIGLNPTATTKQSIQVMEEIAGFNKMLPHLLESDVYKRAINDQVMPRDLGHPDLEYPIMALIERIKPDLGFYADQLSMPRQEGVLQ